MMSIFNVPFNLEISTQVQGYQSNIIILSLSFRRCKTGLYFIVIYLLIIVMLILLLRKFAVFVLLNIYCYFFIPR